MTKVFRLKYIFIKSCFNFAFASFIIFNCCIHESVQGRRIYGWNHQIKTFYRPVMSSQGFTPMSQQIKEYYGVNSYIGNNGTPSNDWRNNGYSNNWYGNGFFASPNYYYRPTQQNSHYYGTPSYYNDYQGSIIDVNIPPPPIKKVPVEVKPIPNHATIEKGPVITSPVATTIPQKSTSEEGQVAISSKDKQFVDVPEYNVEIPADTVENKKTVNPEEISHETDPKGQDDIKGDDGSETSVRIPEGGGQSESGNNSSTYSNNQDNIQGQTNNPQTIEGAENPNQSSNDNVNDGNESSYTNEPTEPPVQTDNISNEDDDIISDFSKNNANDKISNEDDSLISNFGQNNANDKISNEDDSLISNFGQNDANGNISNEDDSPISNFGQNNANGNISNEDDSLISNFGQNNANGNISNEDDSLISNFGQNNANGNISNEDDSLISNFGQNNANGNISNEDDSLISNFGQNNANGNISNEDDNLISNFGQNNTNGNISNEDDSLISNFGQNNANGNISNEDDSLISNFGQNNANGNISNEYDSLISNFGQNNANGNISNEDDSLISNFAQNNANGNTNSDISNEDEGILATFSTNPTTDNNFNGGGNPNEPSSVETVGNEEHLGKDADESSTANGEETEQQSLPDYTDIFDVRLNIKVNDESRVNERRIDENVCGIPGVALPDVGTVDKTSLLPWLVTLGTGNSFDFNFLCGGTIISKSIILSSAHCFHQELPTIAKIGDLYIPVEKIKIHERYNISQVYNNIALIKLASPANTSTILEVCLPNHNSSTPYDGSGMDSSVLEWKVAKTGDLAKPEISISKILPNSHCIKAYENVDNVANYFPRGFDTTLLCVKQQQKSTYCRGDSGVQLYHVSTDNIFTLIGTISDPEDSCGENKYPAVFTKVSSYASWIFDNSVILSQ